MIRARPKKSDFVVHNPKDTFTQTPKVEHIRFAEANPKGFDLKEHILNWLHSNQIPVDSVFIADATSSESPLGLQTKNLTTHHHLNSLINPLLRHELRLTWLSPPSLLDVYQISEFLSSLSKSYF